MRYLIMFLNVRSVSNFSVLGARTLLSAKTSGLCIRQLITKMWMDIMRMDGHLFVRQVGEGFPVVQHETTGEVLIVSWLRGGATTSSRMRHTCKMKNG